LPPSLPGEE
jgi:membrane protein DedA with SNARE-associated domain